MVDTLKLEYEIKKSGHSYKDCADALGITLQGFLNKVRNKTEFKYSEICILAEMIGIDIKHPIFFADKVESN